MFSLGSGHRVNLVCECAHFIQGPSFLRLCLIPNFFLLFSPAIEYSRCWLPVEEKPSSKWAVLVESLAVSLPPVPVASVLPQVIDSNQEDVCHFSPTTTEGFL